MDEHRPNENGKEELNPGAGDDAAVAAFLARWTEKKEQYRASWEKHYWPAKYVKTVFTLNGKEYTVTPDSIGLKTGDCWDEGFTEYLQREFESDLRALGAVRIRHLGFLD